MIARAATGINVEINEAALRAFCARILGWAPDRTDAVEHAVDSIYLSVGREAVLVLLGETDLVPLAHALHQRTLGVGQPFVVCDPRRGDLPSTVRSPGNYKDGVAGFMAATGGSSCVRHSRRPRDFPSVVALVRDPSARVQLTVCADARHDADPFVTLPVPIQVPSLRTRTAELPRIVDEYAADAIAKLKEPEPSFTAADRQWVIKHAPMTLAEITRQIGAGGQAEVLLATVRGAEGFHRLVAVKRVRSDQVNAAKAVMNLINEAHVTARLSHPNVVGVLDVDHDKTGQPLLVMEYVDGVDLGKLIETGPVPYPIVSFIVRELLSGLGYIHEPKDQGRGRVRRGLVHRDVSPGNVLLSWEGEVKLADFGVAQMLERTMTAPALATVGKRGYMSPEQVNRQELDGRSDLYTVEIVMWELLTHRRFPTGAAGDIAAVFRAVPRPSAYRQDVPADLEAVAMRLLAYDREARYRTADLAAHDLMRCRDIPRDGRGDRPARGRSRAARRGAPRRAVDGHRRRRDHDPSCDRRRRQRRPTEAQQGAPGAAAALAELPKRGLGVLSSDGGSFLVYRTMLKAIRRLYKRAGVVVPRSETGRTMPFHSLRHTFGSECARRGIPVMTLRDLMGHEDVKTTQRYVTVTSADKRNAIERAFGQQVGNTLPKEAEDPRILVEKP